MRFGQRRVEGHRLAIARRAPAPGGTPAPPAATSRGCPAGRRWLRPARSARRAPRAAIRARARPADPAGKRCCARASGAWICGRSPRSCSSQTESSVTSWLAWARRAICGSGPVCGRTGERRSIGDSRSGDRRGAGAVAAADSSVSIRSTSSSASWRCASATSRRSSAWAWIAVSTCSAAAAGIEALHASRTRSNSAGFSARARRQSAVPHSTWHVRSRRSLRARSRRPGRRIRGHVGDGLGLIAGLVARDDVQVRRADRHLGRCGPWRAEADRDERRRSASERRSGAS